MPIIIDNIKLTRKTDSPSKCHIVPCKIHYNGPAKVDKYFHPKLTNESTGYISYLRGRKLHGHKINLKENYTGLLLKEVEVTDRDRQQALIYNDNDNDDDEVTDLPRKFVASELFSEITVWHHESQPEASDPWIAGLTDWVNLAHVIHDDDNEK